jgi:hypothetical protein
LGAELHDYEAIALNLRKILEIIAFSSLVANKDKYAEAHDKFDREWRAQKILEKMEKIHPNFYPKPANIKMLDNGIRHLEPVQDNGALTKEEFSELYDKCSKTIHTWNPFTQAPRVVNFRLSLDEWMKKIANLLSSHYVQLVDDAGYWLCFMKDASDGKPHVYTLQPAQNPNLPLQS